MIAISRSAFAAAALALSAAAPAQADGYDLSAVVAVPELAARVPQVIRERGVLIIGSDNAYAPWEYLAGADGQTPEGIDVDLGKAIAGTLDLKFESRTAPFQSILPALGANYDLGISAFSVTNERKAAVNFVLYSNTYTLWVVRAGNPTGFDPADYCGRTVAQLNSGFQARNVDADSAACVAAGKPAINKLLFASQPEAMTRVAAGGADATATGGASAAYGASRSRGALQTLPAVGTMGIPGPNGIAVAKADMELTQLIADTMEHLIETGVYRGIYDHWGIGQFAVDEPTINPSVD